MNSAWKSYGCIFVAGCLWGTNGLFVKLMQGAGSTSAYTGFVRIALSLLILTVTTLVKEGPKAFKISKNTLISCALLGLVCQALYIMYTVPQSTVWAYLLSCVMTYMAPAFASVISYFLFREKFGPNKYLAMILNLAGCVLTVTGGSLKGMSFCSFGIAVWSGICGMLFTGRHFWKIGIRRVFSVCCGNLQFPVWNNFPWLVRTSMDDSSRSDEFQDSCVWIRVCTDSDRNLLYHIF